MKTLENTHTHFYPIKKSTLPHIGCLDSILSRMWDQLLFHPTHAQLTYRNIPTPFIASTDT